MTCDQKKKNKSKTGPLMAINKHTFVQSKRFFFCTKHSKAIFIHIIRKRKLYSKEKSDNFIAHDNGDDDVALFFSLKYLRYLFEFLHILCVCVCVEISALTLKINSGQIVLFCWAFNLIVLYYTIFFVFLNIFHCLKLFHSLQTELDFTRFCFSTGKSQKFGNEKRV